jgi:3-oxoadipate enol-lactonase
MPYQQVGELQMYYEWHGADDAFPVVCINGLLMDTTSWAYQVPALSAHFRVLTYDCRGQGRSDKPAGSYPQALHASDLRGLLDALGVERAHIIGLSNGGTVAMNFTLDNPAMVERLILIDTFAYADALMRAKLQSWLDSIDAGGPDLRFSVGSPWVWGRSFMGQNADLLERLRERTKMTDPEAARSLISGTLVYDLRERLPEIKASTLVMVGEEDVLTPTWYSRELAEHIPDTQMVVVPQAGHALTIERPAIVNALVLTFLQNLA